MTPSASFVDETRDDFLSDPALPSNQDLGIRPGGAVYVLLYALPGGAGPEELD